MATGYPKDMDLKKIAMPGFLSNQKAALEMLKLGDLPHSLALGTLGMPGYVSFKCHGSGG